MSTDPTHLRPTVSDRGFRHMPPVVGTYDSTVKLYESSAADGPHVWLMITSTDRRYDDCNSSLTAHLELTELVKLGEQIEWMKTHHYQGEWESTTSRRHSWFTRFTSWIRLNRG